MSESTANLRRKISGAGDLQSVVRTMKAMAASSISQYENSVLALADYYRTVELGLVACLRKVGSTKLQPKVQGTDAKPVNVVVFGSDQGLVGQFNDVVADYAIKTLAALSGKPQVWAVGERVHARLVDAGLPLAGLYNVPNSVKAITPLIGQILIESESHPSKDEATELYLFHNHPTSAAVYSPVSQRLLPLDDEWRRSLAEQHWPTKNLPEVIGGGTATLQTLIREHLFVSLFRACAESLASENASRLAAMQRADKNIDELLEELNSTLPPSYAKVESTRNFSMSSPALKRCQRSIADQFIRSDFGKKCLGKKIPVCYFFARHTQIFILANQTGANVEPHFLTTHGEQMKRLWFAFAAVLFFSFMVLGWIGTRIYYEMPPIPDQFVTTDGQILIDTGEVTAGQNVWQTMGGMEVGSIWGHGSYVAPDWTADWLHREAVFILDQLGRVGIRHRL